MKRRRNQVLLGQNKSLELLEQRYALAALVAVENGDLIITGTTAGELAITATEAGVFTVTEGDASLGEFTGVTDDIKIKLTTEVTNVDRVLLDLNSQVFDSITVDLGDGENYFALENGSAGLVQYRGGAGPDFFTLGEQATVEGLTATVGSGDNTIVIAGDIERTLAVKAGQDADTVTITESASIGRDVLLNLGNGANHISIAGSVGGSVVVHGGNDDDVVKILATAAAERDVVLLLGNGSNSVDFGGTAGGLFISGGVDDDLIDILAGAQIERSAWIVAGGGTNSLVVGKAATAADDAVIAGSLVYLGGSGADTVEIAAEASIAKHVQVQLASGANTFTDAGAIGGNLTIRTGSEDDIISIDPIAIIGGDTTTIIGDGKGAGAHRKPIERLRGLVGILHGLVRSFGR